jgi:hypothetical protein
LGFSFKDFFLERFLQRSEVSVASDSAELLLAPQQRTGTPTWGHRATSPALDPATERLGLAKAALNQVGRRQALAQ